MKSLKEILVTEEIENNFPIFEEKGKFKFKNEIENVKDYTLVGYIKIQNELKQVKSTTAYIPIGTALKSPILAKYGPQLKVSIEPIGTVSVDFKTSFESAGINQTRHRIYLEAKTQVKVVIPLTTSTKEVKAQIPICETIIVGEVPESYVNVPAEIAPNMLPK